MDTGKAAILVDVVRAEGGPPQYRERAAILVSEIVSFVEVEPSARADGSRERCRINLADAPVENESWVFRSDADDEPGARAVWVEQTHAQVTALVELARSENRAVETKDLGDAVVAAWRRGTGRDIVVPATVSFTLKKEKKAKSSDEPGA
jgi:hypothetical protein